jgi:riboflavin biosynthesis pyrimidine reductase
VTSKVLRLFPSYDAEQSLEGLYLAHDLRSRAAGSDRSYVYANFITSLDGRIAVPSGSGPDVQLAEAITNPRDWRLFQELAVQADVIISSGRYLREHAQGAKQEILDLYIDPEVSDLRTWRTSKGLPPYPDLAVISARLDFPVPTDFHAASRRLFVLTPRSAPAEQVERLVAEGAEVLFAGDDSVHGARVVDLLRAQDCRLIYSAAGPKISHLLLADDVLDRLYLSLAGKLLGGAPFASIVEGPLLSPPPAFRLHELYWDREALDGAGQLFTSYDRLHANLSTS